MRMVQDLEGTQWLPDTPTPGYSSPELMDTISWWGFLSFL